ncbi:MAG: hypothetical protein JXB26_18430 [Candidatus Aminicenantes bacterium]|nr:hypothetical protein [Candidatus Aminicenantes bacterium]
MRKLIMILMGVIILFLSSIIYRERITPVTTHFPVKRLGKELSGEVKLNLILYFSMNNCIPCLKVIDLLDELPDEVRVIGIVPEKEIMLTNEIREKTGALFPIQSLKRSKRYNPIYAPTLYGVGSDGIIYFILPCVGFEETYFREYLTEFLRKAYPLLQSRQGK